MVRLSCGPSRARSYPNGPTDSGDYSFPGGDGRPPTFLGHLHWTAGAIPCTIPAHGISWARGSLPAMNHLRGRMPTGLALTLGVALGWVLATHRPPTVK